MARDPDGEPDGGTDPGDTPENADGEGATADSGRQGTADRADAPDRTDSESADGDRRTDTVRSDDPVGPGETGDSNARAVRSSRHTSPEPHVSVTIEGEYDSVFERIQHPQVSQHSELDAIVANIEETLQAVLRTGGGIRSEIYDATDFELEDPWEIRMYLEVLAMHDLIRLQNDRWVPSDYFEGAARDDDARRND
jgi:hypothetical protein